MDLLRIPPFRDAHVHFTRDGRAVSEEALEEIMETFLGSGIFSVGDMGHRTGVGFDAKERWGGVIEIRTAGLALCGSGGYGSFLGRAVSRDEIKSAVEEVAKAGADFIKVINSGIVSTKGSGQVTAGGFAYEELKMLCQEAAGWDLEVACHANSDRAIRDAVSAGASSIEHGFFVSREVLHMLAEASVSWTPTAYALLSLAPGLPAEGGKYIEEIVDAHLASVSYAASIGVKICAGTDSGSKGVGHGDAFFEELRLFQRAGLALEDILASACMAEEEIGKGNFLLVGRNFMSTRRIEAAYRAWKPLRREF